MSTHSYTTTLDPSSQIIKGKFTWGGGAFSVSHSDVARVARHIANQEEHHRKRTYAEEYELFVKRYGLEWTLRKTIEMVACRYRSR